MIDEQKAYIQALSDVRSWHRWQLGQKSDHHMHGRESHEEAIAYLDLLIAAKRRHAAEDEADDQRARAANSQTGGPQI